MVISASAPTGLHLHLLPAGPTWRFAVWFEQYPDPRALQAYDKSPRKSDGPHPGCVKLNAKPPWIPADLPTTHFAVELPRLHNGHPIPLPGLMSALSLTSFKTQGRTITSGVSNVYGWILPPALSLGPLRALIHDWTRRYGEGFLAPQCAAVVTVLDALRELLIEGPLLPTLALPVNAWREQGTKVSAEPAPNSPVVWVPPVPLARVHHIRDTLAAATRLAPADDPAAVLDPSRAHPRIDDPNPASLALFLTEILGAAAERGSPEQGLPPPWTETSMRMALAGGKLTTLHDSLQSCLHPHHPLFRPPGTPKGHLHARLHAGKSEAGVDRPWTLSLAVAEEKASPMGLRELTEQGALRHGSVAGPDGTVWFHPAAIAHRDWDQLVRWRAHIFARPELLADGRTHLEEAETQDVLALNGWKAHRAVMQEFLQRLKLEHAGRARDFVGFTAAPAHREAVKLRVRWNPMQDLETTSFEEEDEGGALRLLRFRPELLVVLGDDELTPEEAAKYLQESTGVFVKIGVRVVPRADLEALLELARARAKVLERLGGVGLNWAKVMELEDDWNTERDAMGLESVFAAQWEQFLDKLRKGEGLRVVETPEGFRGTLRPYQLRGLSWMSFLADHGIGACLADDMGLGKTVQVLALLWERRQRNRGKKNARPDLVVCPTSVVANWAREAKRFAPEIRVYVHQDVHRATDPEGFRARVDDTDLVITSFALVRRDRALFEPTRWDLLVVDEAQNIKNPGALQTQVLKGLLSRRCIALTGTPVENHLRDLWSIFDLAMPGLLGGPTRFTKAFLGPIRAGDGDAMERLKLRVGPFLLRRTKHDKDVIDDLPPKQEQRVDCELTREQAALYRAMTEATFDGIRTRSGMDRRAHILAALTGLKQICNHPENYTTEDPEKFSGRSGKLDRCMELLGELMESGEPTLIFTQYREMGVILQRAIEARWNVEVPFFHGGLGPEARDEMITSFSAEDGAPILILSLKAGGTGLNLTRATAVIHYDRWWNPAVEDQATDRAHRIGQTRRVNVYKFVTRGTLEERIQQMLDEKRALAAEVLSAAGETWLTEMSDGELRSFLTLDESVGFATED